MRKVKPWVLPFAVVLALVIVLGSTLAWFTSASGVLNALRREPRGTFRIEAVDVFTPPENPGKGTQNIAKRVGAVNTQDIPGFVRLLVIPTFVTDDGTLLPAAFGIHVIINDLNTTHWRYCPSDGYYYYLDILMPGKSTDIGDLNRNLFNTLEIAGSLPEEYNGATLKIEIKSEAVNDLKWNYREGWWGSQAPPTDSDLLVVDNALKVLAR